MAVLTATYRRSPALSQAHPSRWVPQRPSVVLRTEDGDTLDMDLTRWHDPATAEEQDLLAAVEGPVIDLGCGPGRLVVSLTSRCVPALGVDSSPSAIALARARGATVLQRDLFESLPGEGRWATALLFDGNVGIGGDPVRLLARCRRLIAPRGRVVVEVGPPGTGWSRLSARLEHDGRRSPRFAWAVVGADAIDGLAGEAGLRLATIAGTWSGRWFAHLERE
ncbi:MAG: class I SAM-dependent methyltransferase [Actinomycetota bacterium]|nr:class I SAM-dependent methyltransferase [Actinomycetota bacterium]